MKMCKYIYCFIDSESAASVEKILYNEGLSTVEYEGITAIVSDSGYEKIEELDKESLAYILVNHQKKLEMLMREGCTPIIPVQLGTIVSSSDSVKYIIRYGKKIINNILKEIKNIIEYDLVAVWEDFNNVINEISKKEEIVILKNSLSMKSEYSKEDVVGIGKIIKRMIDEENKKVSDEVIKKLMECCIDIRNHEGMNDQMLINSAFLLFNEKNTIFCNIIDEVDRAFENEIKFKIVGPLPCYSFYTIQCKSIKKSEIDNAKNILDIRECYSIAEIKISYRKKVKTTHPDKNLNNNKNDKFIEIQNAYKLLLEYADIINKMDGVEAQDELYHIKIRE